MEFKSIQLANGLTIIGEINNNAQSASVGFFTKTGARDENSSISGVSHFLEHMMFKGTETMDYLQVNQAFDRTGAKFNAFTSEENTVYYAAVLPEYLQDVAKLWCQLLRPCLREEDFNIEKNVIKEEIAMYKDMPQFEVFDNARSLHFDKHPCGNSVLGTNESIDNMTNQQMKDYFNSRYAPDNIVAAIAGNFDFDQMVKLIDSHCGKWQRSNPTRQTADFDGTCKKERIINPKLSMEHICIIQRGLSMQDEKRFAVSLLSSIIGDSTGSRYFWQLVDPAIAEDASMQFEAMDGTGAIFSYISCSPENAQKAIDITDNIFDDISKNGVSSDELVMAQNKLLSAITIKNELPMGRLVELGFNWIYLDKYVDINTTVNKIKSVSLEEINILCKELKLQNNTRLSIGPQK